MEFKKLSEIAHIEISGVDKKIKEGEKIVRLCNFTDVYYNWDLGISDSGKFMIASANPQEIAKFSLRQNDVVITKDSETRGDIGISCFIAENLDNTILGYHCALIRPNEGIDGSYLNACLKTSTSRKYFSNQAGGSGQRYTLTVDGIESVKVPVIPIEKQRKIGKLFSDISHKIRINNQINDNLQQLAMDIFMHFFFKKSPNGLLGDIIVENKKSRIQVGEMKGKSGAYPFFTSGKAILRANSPLIEGRNVFLNTGGNADVKFYVGECSYSTDTWSITGNGDLSDYLYLHLLLIKPELDRKFFKGTGLKHLQKDLLRMREIYIPSENEIASFNSTVGPLFDRISANLKENSELESLRNYLLPLLMSGQAALN